MIINDSAVTLAKLASDALTNLAIANQTATALDVTSSTGADATILSSDGSVAGLVPAVDKRKLDDTIYVTDEGADPTGVADSSAAVQSAINKAVANLIGTVKFPKGNYRLVSAIDLNS